MSKRERYLYPIELIVVMPKVKVNNMVKFCSLYLLASGPKHGYELMKELEDKLGRRISASNIYPFLDTLIKNKIIKIKKTGKREKKTYALTNEGRIFIKNMFNRFGDLIDIAIEPKLTTCSHCSCRVFEGGHSEKVKGRLLKFCCMHCASSYKRHHK